MKSSMRRLIIDKLLTEKDFVPFEQFVSVLKVSEPTIKRDLRFMREELGAPIRYSRARDGYFYSTASREVSTRRPKVESKVQAIENRRVTPRLAQKQWYSSDELYVLTSAYDLLGALELDRTSALSAELAPLRARVLGLFTLGGTKPRDLMRHVRIVNRGTPFREPETFETIGCALCEKRRVKILYYSWHSDEHTDREISPLRLVHYRNRWYVDAFCHSTQALKTFLIENIKTAEILPSGVKRMTLESVAQELDAGYGIFHGRQVVNAKLLFTEEAARYALRESWHPKQRVEQLDDGSLMLSVPYTNPTELVGEVLRWGSRVKVVEPEELKVKVRDEAERIAALYSERPTAGSQDQ
ncbi:YafY family protein [Sutterella sp.]|uniref:helix-turn-helix transcriptional regulator n=1 Tax=Sutterella sp. TaxID=1981025 RepID=UPI0026E0E76A|nr:WYL domain-containing protein [Sutterella sp.]MDO5531510.1 WYL domain-containing protein [Sutterella sp.]